MLGQIQKKDKQWIEITQTVANTLSKCKRAKYACLYLNKLGHVVGMGYNGKPRGCDDSVCWRDGGKEACCIHAEDNATSWSDPSQRQGGTVYVSGIPCDMCASRLLNSGVARIVYLVESTCQDHICNIIDSEFWEKRENGVEVVPFNQQWWEYKYGQ